MDLLPLLLLLLLMNLLSMGQLWRTNEKRISGAFCSKTVFNFSHKTLTESEINALEKVLDFAPVQRTLNEPELRKE